MACVVPGISLPWLSMEAGLVKVQWRSIFRSAPRERTQSELLYQCVLVALTVAPLVLLYVWLFFGREYGWGVLLAAAGGFGLFEGILHFLMYRRMFIGGGK